MGSKNRFRFVAWGTITLVVEISFFSRFKYSVVPQLTVHNVEKDDSLIVQLLCIQQELQVRFLNETGA